VVSNISKNKVVFFQYNLLAWFKDKGRHHLPWRTNNLNPYEIVISETLLQRTKAETIEKFYANFISRFPNWESIVETDTEIIEEYLKPIGLYRQRSKRLKDLAAEMARRNGQFPNEREELEQIPFLGQYIVNSILLQIHNIPSPLLDVNMARVLERYFGERKLSDIRYDPYLQELAYKIVNHHSSKELNWAILDFAAAICKARKPLCENCFLKSTCIYYKKI
jgi:A/G-specific adenine glycosylase